MIASTNARFLSQRKLRRSCLPLHLVGSSSPIASKSGISFFLRRCSASPLHTRCRRSPRLCRSWSSARRLRLGLRWVARFFIAPGLWVHFCEGLFFGCGGGG